MDPNILFLICIVGLAVLIPLNKKLMEHKAQVERKKAIERQMRQDIKDTKTVKEVANKLLREAGEQP